MLKLKSQTLWWQLITKKRLGWERRQSRSQGEEETINAHNMKIKVNNIGK